MPGDLRFGWNNSDLPQLLAHVCFAEVRDLEACSCIVLRFVLFSFLFSFFIPHHSFIYENCYRLVQQIYPGGEKSHIPCRGTQLGVESRGAAHRGAHVCSDVAKSCDPDEHVAGLMQRKIHWAAWRKHVVLQKKKVDFERNIFVMVPQVWHNKEHRSRSDASAGNDHLPCE